SGGARGPRRSGSPGFRSANEWQGLPRSRRYAVHARCPPWSRYPERRIPGHVPQAVPSIHLRRCPFVEFIITGLSEPWQGIARGDPRGAAGFGPRKKAPGRGPGAAGGRRPYFRFLASAAKSLRSRLWRSESSTVRAPEVEEALPASASVEVAKRLRTLSPKAVITPMAAMATSATTMTYSVMPWPSSRPQRLLFQRRISFFMAVLLSRRPWSQGRRRTAHRSIDRP